VISKVVKPVFNKPKVDKNTNIVDKRSSPWAVMQQTSVSSFSLQDVIDEELRRSNVVRPTKKSMDVFARVNNEERVKSSKMWKNPDISSHLSSFSKIVEMEKNSIEIVKQQKKRPLNWIQLEERAIEQLKKEYDIENLAHMTISIELFEDTPSVAPIWKKAN